MDNYFSLLESTNNTRDLGGYRCEGGGTTKFRSFLRSELQPNPTENDYRFLLENNITTIVDMREGTAREEQRSGFDGKEGFYYFLCPIDVFKALPETAEIIPQLYYEIAHDPGTLHIFQVMADAPGGCMFNCRFGKDRTGVIAAILLKLAGVSNEDILHNYMLTLLYNAPLFREMHRLCPPETDLDGIFLPHAHFLQGFFRRMEAEYSSAREYLLHLGLTEQQVNTLRAKLVED